eukprot:CFRG0102T1
MSDFSSVPSKAMEIILNADADVAEELLFSGVGRTAKDNVDTVEKLAVQNFTVDFVAEKAVTPDLTMPMAPSSYIDSETLAFCLWKYGRIMNLSVPVLAASHCTKRLTNSFEDGIIDEQLAFYKDLFSHLSQNFGFDSWQLEIRLVEEVKNRSLSPFIVWKMHRLKLLNFELYCKHEIDDVDAWVNDVTKCSQTMENRSTADDMIMMLLQCSFDNQNIAPNSVACKFVRALSNTYKTCHSSIVLRVIRRVQRKPEQLQILSYFLEMIASSSISLSETYNAPEKYLGSFRSSDDVHFTLLQFSEMPIQSSITSEINGTRQRSENEVETSDSDELHSVWFQVWRYIDCTKNIGRLLDLVQKNCTSIGASGCPEQRLGLVKTTIALSLFLKIGLLQAESNVEILLSLCENSMTKALTEKVQGEMLVCMAMCRMATSTQMNHTFRSNSYLEFLKMVLAKISEKQQAQFVVETFISTATNDLLFRAKDQCTAVDTLRILDGDPLKMQYKRLVRKLHPTLRNGESGIDGKKRKIPSQGLIDDINKVMSAFLMNRKLTKHIHEMLIFRRKYYIEDFLPLLFDLADPGHKLYLRRIGEGSKMFEASMSERTCEGNDCVGDYVESSEIRKLTPLIPHMTADDVVELIEKLKSSKRIPSDAMKMIQSVDKEVLTTTKLLKDVDATSNWAERIPIHLDILKSVLESWCKNVQHPDIVSNNTGLEIDGTVFCYELDADLPPEIKIEILRIIEVLQLGVSECIFDDEKGVMPRRLIDRKSNEGNDNNGKFISQKESVNVLNIGDCVHDENVTLAVDIILNTHCNVFSVVNMTTLTTAVTKENEERLQNLHVLLMRTWSHQLATMIARNERVILRAIYHRLWSLLCDPQIPLTSLHVFSLVGLVVTLHLNTKPCVNDDVAVDVAVQGNCGKGVSDTGFTGSKAFTDMHNYQKKGVVGGSGGLSNAANFDCLWVTNGGFPEPYVGSILETLCAHLSKGILGRAQGCERSLEVVTMVIDYTQCYVPEIRASFDAATDEGLVMPLIITDTETYLRSRSTFIKNGKGTDSPHKRIKISPSVQQNFGRTIIDEIDGFSFSINEWVVREARISDPNAYKYRRRVIEMFQTLIPVAQVLSGIFEGIIMSFIEVHYTSLPAIVHTPDRHFESILTEIANTTDLELLSRHTGHRPTSWLLRAIDKLCTKYEAFVCTLPRICLRLAQMTIPPSQLLCISADVDERGGGRKGNLDTTENGRTIVTVKQDGVLFLKIVRKCWLSSRGTANKVPSSRVHLHEPQCAWYFTPCPLPLSVTRYLCRALHTITVVPKDSIKNDVIKAQTTDTNMRSKHVTRALSSSLLFQSVELGLSVLLNWNNLSDIFEVGDPDVWRMYQGAWNWMLGLDRTTCLEGKKSPLCTAPNGMSTQLLAAAIVSLQYTNMRNQINGIHKRHTAKICADEVYEDVGSLWNSSPKIGPLVCEFVLMAVVDEIQSGAMDLSDLLNINASEKNECSKAAHNDKGYRDHIRYLIQLVAQYVSHCPRNYTLFHPDRNARYDPKISGALLCIMDKMTNEHDTYEHTRRAIAPYVWYGVITDIQDFGDKSPQEISPAQLRGPSQGVVTIVLYLYIDLVRFANSSLSQMPDRNSNTAEPNALTLVLWTEQYIRTTLQELHKKRKQLDEKIFADFIRSLILEFTPLLCDADPNLLSFMQSLS